MRLDGSSEYAGVMGIHRNHAYIHLCIYFKDIYKIRVLIHRYFLHIRTTMLANSEFVALLKQANTDSSKMAEVIGVSEAQLRFVTNTASGMGLIKCGSVVIPFDNQISKDTDLYRLYNTNIHEKIAEQKKKEAMLQ